MLDKAIVAINYLTRRLTAERAFNSFSHIYVYLQPPLAPPGRVISCCTHRSVAAADETCTKYCQVLWPAKGAPSQLVANGVAIGVWAICFNVLQQLMILLALDLTAKKHKQLEPSYLTETYAYWQPSLSPSRRALKAQ